jgi:hypothetical protein
MAQNISATLVPKASFTVMLPETGEKLTLKRDEFQEPLKISKREESKFLVATKRYGNVWIGRSNLDMNAQVTNDCRSLVGAQTIARKGASGAGECHQ